jgi:hypothetical protein
MERDIVSKALSIKASLHGRSPDKFQTIYLLASIDFTTCEAAKFDHFTSQIICEHTTVKDKVLKSLYTHTQLPNHKMQTLVEQYE